MEGMGEMECLVLLVLKDREESKDRKESKEQQVLLVQGMVGWSTQGGGKKAAQVSLELN